MTPAPDSDADLVARAVSGDRAAFGVLARRHGARLARTIRALGVRPSDVEDVLQAALIAAWRNLADFDRAQSFPAWSSRIAANKARDWGRHARRRRPWLTASPLDAPEALSAVDAAQPPEGFEDRAELRRVQAAVAALPEKLRVPLVMVTVTDLTQAETAAALGVSLKTVEMRISRARQKLKALLGIA